MRTLEAGILSRLPWSGQFTEFCWVVSMSTARRIARNLHAGHELPSNTVCRGKKEAILIYVRRAHSIIRVINIYFSVLI